MKNENDISKYIGRRLANIRRAKNLTQDQLAKLAHVSPSEVSRIERGINSANIETILNFCNALEIGFPRLFQETSEYNFNVSSDAPNLQDVISLVASMDQKHYKYIMELIIVYKSSHQD